MKHGSIPSLKHFMMYMLNTFFYINNLRKSRDFMKFGYVLGLRNMEIGILTSSPSLLKSVQMPCAVTKGTFANYVTRILAFLTPLSLFVTQNPTIVHLLDIVRNASSLRNM
jgi:hypothetical protein